VVNGSFFKNSFTVYLFDGETRRVLTSIVRRAGGSNAVAKVKLVGRK